VQISTSTIILKSAIGIIAACVAPMAMAATGAITLQQARQAAEASIRLNPGSDIDSDYRVAEVQLADLDGNGVQEIVYLVMATCVGAGFDCPNDLMVMTPLAPEDQRVTNPYPGLTRYDDETYAAMQASGYADDAGEQIPGDVERIRISGQVISVTFVSKEDSPICLRVIPGPDGPKPTTHCPPPGRYTWRYAWTPGKLTRMDSP
jgi:hypothetical protein